MTKEIDEKFKRVSDILDQLLDGTGRGFICTISKDVTGVSMSYMGVEYYWAPASWIETVHVKHLKAAIALSLAKKIDETVDILDGEFHREALAILAPLWWGKK